MSQPIQVLQSCAFVLCHYYATYMKLDMHIDYPINEEIVQRLTNYLIQQFQRQCPYFSLDKPGNVLDSFGLFDDPFSEDLMLEDHPNLFSEMLKQLIQFPKDHYYVIHNDYRILSINPIPFDSMDITHGMLVTFFTNISV